MVLEGDLLIESTRMSVLDPPFALDDDVGSVRTIQTERSSISQGFKKGGPKEARLFRTALLAPQRDVDHLHPVRVQPIPRTANHAELEKQLKSIAPDVDDIYIPRDYKSNKPKSDFAVLRFSSKKSAQDLLSKQESTIQHDIDEVSLVASPVSKQPIKFSKGTGYMGITNEAFDDGTRNFNEKVAIKQDIEFENVLSRNGAPWSSQRELKFLGKKTTNLNVEELFSIRIENIPTHVKPSDLRSIFEKFGDVGEVFFPKPLNVNAYLSTKEPNCGYGFVRYGDVRDMKAALASIKEGNVVVDGNVITGEELPPHIWPTDKTRRFY